MDFKGQKLAETAGVWIVTVFAVLAFLVGYARQDFQAMVTLFGGGCALAAVATVPDWPVYNRHPVRFLPAKPTRRGAGGGGGSGGGGRKAGSASWSNLWGMF